MISIVSLISFRLLAYLKNSSSWGALVLVLSFGVLAPVHGNAGHSKSLTKEVSNLAVKLPEKVGAASGFRVVHRNCKLYRGPSTQLAAVLSVQKGKKLWLEPFDSRWSIAFNRTGESVFLPNQCLDKPEKTASL